MRALIISMIMAIYYCGQEIYWWFKPNWWRIWNERIRESNFIMGVTIFLILDDINTITNKDDLFSTSRWLQD